MTLFLSRNQATSFFSFFLFVVFCFKWHGIRTRNNKKNQFSFKERPRLKDHPVPVSLGRFGRDANVCLLTLVTKEYIYVFGNPM